MRPTSKSCRVLLVDETLDLPEVARSLFKSGEIAPSGAPCRFSGMLSAVLTQLPDVVVVDLTTAEEAYSGIEAVMAERPTPILVLRPNHLTVAESFRALALGALDVAERPERPSPQFWEAISRKLILLSQVRVVQHVKGKRRKKKIATLETGEAPFPLVAIAASLGGPKALSVILRMISPAFPAPICICQHISDGFTAGLAQWLASETKLRVSEATDGQPIEPGGVFIAPTGAHLLIGADYRLVLDFGPPIRGFKPSCDALLSSAARTFGRRAIGVVLTGMGRDGASGLKEIKQRGGHTIAQDEATCVVYGMPREALEIGAAEEILPIEQIALALMRWVAT